MLQGYLRFNGVDVPLVETILGAIDDAEMQRVEHRGRFTLTSGEIVNIRKTDYFYQDKLVYSSRIVRGKNNVILMRDDSIHDDITKDLDIVQSEDK